MSFSEDVERFGNQLTRLTDAGVPVKEAAVALGIARERAYAILRAVGRPAGQPRPRRPAPDPALVVSVFDKTGSVNQAAKATGVSHSVARRILVDADLVTAERSVHGKPEVKRRFLELIAQGWSASRAAAEVGVHVRTAQDWRDGTRRVGDTRVHADGTVVDYRAGTVTRYQLPVTTTATTEPARIDARYLSLHDRLAIADGLAVKMTITAIAAGIGKDKSTVSREGRARRIAGRYLPYQAH